MIQIRDLSTILPAELASMVLDYIPTEWRHRFSTDVLPEINRGWRWAGFSSETGDVCPRCYCFGSIYCGLCAEELEYVSYDMLVKCNYDWWNKYLPWSAFEYMHPIVNEDPAQKTFYNYYDSNLRLLKRFISQKNRFKLSTKQLLRKIIKSRNK